MTSGERQRQRQRQGRDGYESACEHTSEQAGTVWLLVEFLKEVFQVGVK